MTVSSRITGVIGSSSNPISGMTIATLLLTCLIFVMLGWVGSEYRLIALSIAAIVCIASSNGGTTSQDLKTGYLVGATPWKQQVAILVGALLSAVLMGGTLLWLNDAYTTVSDRPEDLPSDQPRRLEIDRRPTSSRRQRVQGLVDREPRARRGFARKISGRRDRHTFIEQDPGIGGRLTYDHLAADQEVQPAAASPLRDDHRRHHVRRPSLGPGDPWRGTRHRGAAYGRVVPGLRRRRLSSSLYYPADLCWRIVPPLSTASASSTRRIPRPAPAP